MKNKDNKPKIILSSLDLERLEVLLDAMADNAFPGEEALRAELARAEVVEPQEVPPTVVTMNSTARFQVMPGEEEFELTLVYPKDMDGNPNRISVLAPVGSALLGLSVGQEIEWPVLGGKTTRVKIMDVTYQPERLGIFHR
ncbi:MAG: nucleoside diphosphate kinase regulator [Azovibrio sp.]